MAFRSTADDAPRGSVAARGVGAEARMGRRAHGEGRGVRGRDRGDERADRGGGKAADGRVAVGVTTRSQIIVIGYV